MRICELYAFLNERIPAALSCDWDNDGLMCCADENASVRRVLIALDITDAVVSRAIEGKYDVVVSHHPLIFSPLKALDPRDPVAKKVIRLLRAGITAMSFHTRLDAVQGGVNDTLGTALGLLDLQPFGTEGVRVGHLEKAVSLSDFADTVKRVTGAPCVQASDAGRQVFRVALLGGSGSGDFGEALRSGADTYLSGELKHNLLTDAPECGMNLIAAGHYFTENPVCDVLRRWISELDPSLEIDLIESNAVQFL